MRSMTKLILDRGFPGEFPIVTHALASAVAEELAAAASQQYEVIVKPSGDRAFDATIVVQERSTLTRPKKPK
jgi:protein gp37